MTNIEIIIAGALGLTTLAPFILLIVGHVIVQKRRQAVDDDDTVYFDPDLEDPEAVDDFRG